MLHERGELLQKKLQVIHRQQDEVYADGNVTVSFSLDQAARELGELFLGEHTGGSEPFECPFFPTVVFTIQDDGLGEVPAADVRMQAERVGRKAPQPERLRIILADEDKIGYRIIALPVEPVDIQELLLT